MLYNILISLASLLIQLSKRFSLSSGLITCYHVCNLRNKKEGTIELLQGPSPHFHLHIERTRWLGMVKLPVPRTRVTGSSESLNSASYTKINISLVYKVQQRLGICPARADIVGSVPGIHSTRKNIKSSPVVKNLGTKVNTGQVSRDFADKRFLIGRWDIRDG